MPDVVFETTSDTTRINDTKVKPEVYAVLGIGEYFMYDPTADYLDPQLVGMRQVDGEYEPIEPDSQNRLLCRELGIKLFLENNELVMCDARTGRHLLTGAEAAQADAKAARSRAKAAASKAKSAKAEAERLREKLREHGLLE